MASIVTWPLLSEQTGVDENGFAIYDRAVDDKTYRDTLKQLFTDGVFPNPSTNMQVIPQSGMNVLIKAGGTVFIQGSWSRMQEDAIVTLLSASAHVDRICVRVDFATSRIADIVVKPATEALIRTSSVWELALADVTITAGMASITASNITDLRLDPALCGIVTGAVESVDTATLFTQMQADLEHQESAWNSWFGSAQSNLAQYAQYDFDNLGAQPGNVRATSFPQAGRIYEKITTTANSRVRAERTTDTQPDGSLIATEKVWLIDGVTVQRHTQTTTVFNPDGTVAETVINLI